MHLEVGSDQLIGWEVVRGLVLGGTVQCWALYGSRCRHGGNVFAWLTYSGEHQEMLCKEYLGLAIFTMIGNVLK